MWVFARVTSELAEKKQRNAPFSGPPNPSDPVLVHEFMGVSLFEDAPFWLVLK